MINLAAFVLDVGMEMLATARRNPPIPVAIAVAAVFIVWPEALTAVAETRASTIIDAITNAVAD